MNRSKPSPPAEMDAAALLQRSAQYVTDFFSRLNDRFPTAPPKLLEAIQYSLMAGGKRLRPALVLESARACQDHQDAAEPSPTAVAAAAAMELIHTFSLVHDDLPAMDDDDLRRGRPTNHKVYGEAMAILAGDAMTTIAFEILAADAEPALVPALVGELARASGPAGMIGGQVLDMDERQPPRNLPELQRLHRMKTGALLTASCRMGAIAAAADSPQLQALDAFGRHLGLAFQIVDDILDQTSTPQELGKATKKDAAKGKVTYPMLIGLEKSRAEARQNLSAALAAIDPFGARAKGLRALAAFVVERNK
ncbi:MAG: polyprenyl synthetase family protein [Tepidisphaeraceae bacterium]